MTVKFLATASALPPQRVTNDQLAVRLGLDAGDLNARCGTTERAYIGGGVTGSALCASAIREALGKIGREPADLDAIIASTVTPDHQFPGNAAFTQRELGVTGSATLDLRACDGGFLHTLSAACALLEAGTCHLVALPAADLFSTYVRQDAAGAGVTEWFGDAAAVVILAKSDDAGGIVAIDVGNAPAHLEDFWAEKPGTFVRPRMTRETVEKGDWYFKIDIEAMGRHTLSYMPAVCRRAMEKAGVSAADLRLFVASTIVPAWGFEVAGGLGIPTDRVAPAHRGRGYCGTALIPCALDEAISDGTLKTGDLVLAASVGAGIGFGAMIYRV